MLENFTIICQIAVSLSVAFVWIFRIHNVIKEFNEFGLSDITRSFVGFAKTAISTLLIVGIWHQELVLFSAIGMAFFMAAAQYFHWCNNTPTIKKIPSLILLNLSIFIALSSSNLI